MEDDPKVDLGNIESINNIQTARMALRWALERLHALEAAKAESAERSTRESKWRAEAEAEVRSLKATLAVKGSQHEQRELYYKKIEEFLSLRLAGQVDIAALARRSAEVDELRADFETRLGQLEREFAGRRQALELEYQRLCREAREAAQAGAQQAQAWLLKRQEEWEKDHASMLVDLKERELRVAKQEAELADRQKRLEEFAGGQKARFDVQARELEEQSQARLKMAEKILEERQSAQETGWTREKGLLLVEIALLRRKVQELSPALFEAGRRAEDAAEGLARAQEAERRAEHQARLAKADREADVEKIRDLEAQLEAELSRRSEIEKRLSKAVAEARDAQSALADERLALADQERALLREREAFRAAELEKDAPQRAAELRREYEARLEAAHATHLNEVEELVRRLRERDEALDGHRTARERALEELRSRMTAELEEHLRAAGNRDTEREKARLEETAHWRRKLEESSSRVAELERSLSEALGRAQFAEEKAKAETERRESLARHETAAQSLWREEWETERRSLISKIAGLEESMLHARDEAQAQDRLVAAKAEAQRLALEEKHRRDIEAAREAQASWDETHVREAGEWRRRAESSAEEAHKLQARLAEAEKTERLAKETQAQASLNIQEAKVHYDDMLRRLESDRDREHQDFERLLSERDQAEARLHEELRVTKLSLEETDRRMRDQLQELRLRAKADLEESWKARLSGEEALAERARAALERVSQLEKLAAENDSIVRRAQESLARDAQRHERLQEEAATARQRYDEEIETLRRNLEEREAASRRSLEEREAALYGQLAERESALTARGVELEAAAARAAAEYRARRDELERLKAEVERSVTDLVKKAKGA